MLVILPVTVTPLLHKGAEASAERGREIAERWCASCHLTAPDQTRALADVPTFMSIAGRSDGDLGWLEAFLFEPHPPMPDMRLSRRDIQDLVDYFKDLRGR